MVLIDEVIQVDSLTLPKLALCAQPWGTKFGATGMAASMIEIPTGKTTPLVAGTNYSQVACPAAISHCSCLDFSKVETKPHGKRGELERWEYAQLSFAGKNADPAQEQYAFGFYGGSRLPQVWTYANLGHRTEGDLKYEEVVHGQTEFTEGENESRYLYAVSGESHQKGAATELQFGYDKYLIYSVSAFTSRWELFAMVSLLFMLCAAVNNFGLFEIFFPERFDPDDSAQLSVNPALEMCCGSCFACCNPFTEDEKEARAESSALRGSKDEP
jgi:hypothetical protein